MRVITHKNGSILTKHNNGPFLNASDQPPNSQMPAMYVYWTISTFRLQQLLCHGSPTAHPFTSVAPSLEDKLHMSCH